MSSHTEHGLKWREEQLGRRVLNDVHGVLVFECEPPPAFVTMEITPLKKVQEDGVRTAVSAAAERNALMSGEDSVAYALYSASALVAGSTDARFALLMMAAEALITPKPRGEAVQAHVDHLITETKKADIPDQEIKSILSSLDWLHAQSIGQAGRELAAKLGAREYLGKTPSRFFTDCYTLRSRLLHGQHPVPSMQEVNQYAGPLEVFVADLLSLDLER
jgi:hypothetical protein